METFEIDVKKLLSDLEPYEEIEVDTELIESGILDSLTIVFLVTQIESKYNITIDESKVIPENFISIKQIVKLLVENAGTDEKIRNK